MRDLLLSQVPAVLRVDIYATAALLGSTVMVVLQRLGMKPYGAALIGGTACLVLRRRLKARARRCAAKLGAVGDNVPFTMRMIPPATAARILPVSSPLTPLLRNPARGDRGTDRPSRAGVKLR